MRSFQRWPKPLGLVEHSQWIRHRRDLLAAWVATRLPSLVWFENGSDLVGACQCLACLAPGAQVDVGDGGGEIWCPSCRIRADLADYLRRLQWPEPPIRCLAGRRLA